MRRILLLSLCAVALWNASGASAQFRNPKQLPGEAPNSPSTTRKQETAIVQDDFRRNRDDVTEIRTLAEGLLAGLNREGGFVVDVNAIKSVERIEKLAKDIKGRLKRN